VKLQEAPDMVPVGELPRHMMLQAERLDTLARLLIQLTSVDTSLGELHPVLVSSLQVYIRLLHHQKVWVAESGEQS
jgi:hypothetical protein